MNVVLTGGTGFIGSRVWPLLVAHGHKVTATTRGSDRSAEPRVSWVKCDVAAPSFVDLLPGGADAVVHFAQADRSLPDTGALRAVNVGSTRALLDYAHRVGAIRFILASSGSVYGGSPSPLREDHARRPGDPYARSKSDAEALLEQAPPGIDVCALRIFAPYGPGQSGRLIADLIDRVSSRRPVTLRGDGHPKLSPIFVDDVATIVCRALEIPVPRTLNVAGDAVLSIREMAEAIGRALGISPVFEDAPGDLPPDLAADTTLLRRTFPFELTPFERGIASTVGSPSDR